MRILRVLGIIANFIAYGSYLEKELEKEHVSKGEYDQAIREYKEAKSLELYSHVRGWNFVCSF